MQPALALFFERFSTERLALKPLALKPQALATLALKPLALETLALEPLSLGTRSSERPILTAFLLSDFTLRALFLGAEVGSGPRGSIHPL